MQACVEIAAGPATRGGVERRALMMIERRAPMMIERRALVMIEREPRSAARAGGASVVRCAWRCRR